MFKKNGNNKSEEKAKCDPTSIGNMLISSELVTREQLETALKFQMENQDQMIGEILIAMGILSREAFDAILSKQHVLRNNFNKKYVAQYIQAATKRISATAKATEDLNSETNKLLIKLVAKG
jgi:hypothetical protein